LSDNEILIIDHPSGKKEMTSRILRLKNGKLYPVFNGNVKEDGMLCQISRDEQYICTYSFKTEKIKVFHKGKIVFEGNLLKLLEQDSKYKKILNDTQCWIKAYPYYVNNERFIVCFSMEGRMQEGYFDGTLFDYNYRTGKFEIIDTPRNSRTLPPVIYNVKGEAVFIYLLNSEYYDINNQQAKPLLPEKYLSEHAMRNVRPVWFNEKSFFFCYKSSLFQLDLDTRSMEKLPIPEKVILKYSKNSYPIFSYLIANNRFIMLFQVKDLVILNEKIFDSKNYKPMKTTFFKNLKNPEQKRIEFSPSGNKLLILDRNGKKKVEIVDLPLEYVKRE
jgi:hypothetical protein